MKAKIKFQCSYLAVLLVVLCLGCSQEQGTQPVRKDIIDAVFASGYLVSENEYLVTAKSEGYLKEVFVDEGDTVIQNMPLFYLSDEVPSAQLANAQVNYEDAQQKNMYSSPQIQQLLVQIEQAKAQASTDKTNYERYAKLVKTQAVSQVEFEKIKLQYELSQQNIRLQEKSLADLKASMALNLKNSRNNLLIQQESTKDYYLNSVINGQVFQVLKKPGDLVKRGESIAQIGGGNIKIKLYIAEEDIHSVLAGQKAYISLNTDTDQLYQAVISKIYPAFDTQEQSFIVEATFTEAPERLFAGTQLQANIVIDERKNALVVPTIYLKDGKKLILQGNQEVEVQIGISTSEWTEITGGLEESQTIFIANK